MSSHAAVETFMNASTVQIYESDTDEITIVLIDSDHRFSLVVNVSPTTSEWMTFLKLWFHQNLDRAIVETWLDNREARWDMVGDNLVAIIEDEIVIYHRRCGASARRFFGMEE